MVYGLTDYLIVAAVIDNAVHFTEEFEECNVCDSFLTHLHEWCTALAKGNVMKMIIVLLMHFISSGIPSVTKPNCPLKNFCHCLLNCKDIPTT